MDATDGSLSAADLAAMQHADDEGEPAGGIKPFGCAVPGCNYRAYTSHNMRVIYLEEGGFCILCSMGILLMSCGKT